MVRKLREGRIITKIPLQEKFLYASLEELSEMTAKPGPDMRDFLEDVFSRMQFGENANDTGRQEPQKPLQYEKMFPELFLY